MVIPKLLRESLQTAPLPHLPLNCRIKHSKYEYKIDDGFLKSGLYNY